MAKRSARDVSERSPPESIDKLRAHLEWVWKDAHDHWESVLDSWYHQTILIWPKEYQATRSQYLPSTARSIIDVAADTQLSFEPYLHRNPVSVGRRHEKFADEVETGLWHVIMDAQLHETELSFKAFGKYLAKDGYAVLEGPVLDYSEQPQEASQDDLDEEEYKWAVVDWKNAKKQWNPIRIRAPHPRTVLLDPMEKRPKEAVKIDWFSHERLMELLDAARSRETNKPVTIIAKEEIPEPSTAFDASMEVVEYWSAGWHAMTWSGKLILLEKNAWGFCPFMHAYAGFGSLPSVSNAGTKNPYVMNPRYLAQGLLDAVLPSLTVEAQSESAKHNMLVNYSYPKFIFDGDAAQAQQQLEDDQSDIISGTPEDWGLLKQPELQRWILQVGESAKTDIRQGTYSSDIGGVRQVGVSTVGQQLMLLENAIKKFASVSKQLNHAATIISQNILKFVNRMDEELVVGGHKLGRVNIKDDYFVIAEFRNIDPIMQQQARELGLQEVAAGIKSMRTYLESDLQIANVTEEQKRLMRESVRKTLPYFAVMAEAIANEDGMGEAYKLWKQEQEGPAEPKAIEDGLSPEAGGTLTNSVNGAMGRLNG